MPVPPTPPPPLELLLCLLCMLLLHTKMYLDLLSCSRVQKSSWLLVTAGKFPSLTGYFLSNKCKETLISSVIVSSLERHNKLNYQKQLSLHAGKVPYNRNPQQSPSPTPQHPPLCPRLGCHRQTVKNNQQKYEQNTQDAWHCDKKVKTNSLLKKLF